MTNRRLSRKQKRQTQNDVDHILNKKFAMKTISPLTNNQEHMFYSYEKDKHIAAIGSAGSGKTFLSLYLALTDVLEKNEYEKVIIVRSAVQTREQGFMPGGLNEKMGYYEAPYEDIVNDLFERGDAYSILKQKGMLKFMSSSFVRGLTFDNAIIIVDECQSQTYHELSSIITRVGESSKIIFCGDTKQDDLKTSKNRFDVTGLPEFLKVISTINDFEIIRFTTDDIVRSGLVKKFIIAEERVLEAA
jgi:phosphate starvation-inducible protein PhoH